MHRLFPISLTGEVTGSAVLTSHWKPDHVAALSRPRCSSGGELGLDSRRRTKENSNRTLIIGPCRRRLETGYEAK